MQTKIETWFGRFGRLDTFSFLDLTHHFALLSWPFGLRENMTVTNINDKKSECLGAALMSSNHHESFITIESSRFTLHSWTRTLWSMDHLQVELAKLGRFHALVGIPVNWAISGKPCLESWATQWRYYCHENSLPVTKLQALFTLVYCLCKSAMSVLRYI